MMAHLYEAEAWGGGSVKNRGGSKEKKNSLPTALINNRRV